MITLQNFQCVQDNKWALNHFKGWEWLGGKQKPEVVRLTNLDSVPVETTVT